MQYEGGDILGRLSDRPTTACSQRDVKEHIGACIRDRSWRKQFVRIELKTSCSGNANGSHSHLG